MSQHLEIETYTWDVLPAEYRSEGVTNAIAREIEWVVAEIARPAEGAPPART